MCPPGDMADFVKSSNSGIVVPGTDVEGAADAIARLYGAKQEGRNLITPDRSKVERFERRELSKRLASALDELVATKKGRVR
jgi:hypothetical protein